LLGKLRAKLASRDIIAADAWSHRRCAG